MVRVNGRECEYIPGTSIASLLEGMNYSASRVAVECNGEIVPRKAFSEKEVKDGDVLEIVSFVGGG